LPLPNLDPHVGAQRGAKFHQENGAIFLEGKPTPAFENRWQHDLHPGLLLEDAEGQAFQVGLSTTILSLEANCGSDYDR